MAILFQCDCGASQEVRDDLAGQLWHCPHCGFPSRVKGSPAAKANADEVVTIQEDMLVPVAETAAPLISGGRVDFEKGMPLAPRLTLSLIVANVAVYIFTLSTGGLANEQTIIRAGALSRSHVFQGEWWRLFSAMFLHGGFDHLFGNCIALYILGMACEHAFGLGQMGVVYLLAGLGGSLLSIAFGPGPSVGASGAIFGLMGAGIVFFHRHGHRFILRDNRLGMVLLVWALYSLATGAFAPFVDNGAHIGGLLAGALIASALHPVLLDRTANLPP